MTKRQRRRLVLLAIGGTLVILCTPWVWLNHLASSSYDLVIGLPMDAPVTGGRTSVAFILPKGRYMIAAKREGLMDIMDIKGAPSKIRYHLEVPEQGLAIDEETLIEFSYGAQEIRLKQFRLIRNHSGGYFSVEVVDPGRRDFQLQLVRNPFP